jgi:hypothetical protein
LLDPGDDIEKDRAHFGFAEIARQDGVAARQHTQFGDALEQGRDDWRRHRAAAPFSVAGVV